MISLVALWEEQRHNMCTVATIKFRSNLSVPYKIFLLGGKRGKWTTEILIQSSPPPNKFFIWGENIKEGSKQPSPPPKYDTPISNCTHTLYMWYIHHNFAPIQRMLPNFFFHAIGNICYMYIYQTPNWSKIAIAKPKQGWGYILVPPKHLQCKLQIHPRGAYTSITPSANATPPILLEHTTKCGG